MSAEESVSPRQFGYLAFKPNVEKQIGDRLDYGKFQRRRIRLDQPFRSSQADMYQQPFEHYLQNSSISGPTFKGHQQPHPEVVRYKGENVVWAGHHRIAAARRRGQKTMSLNYQEVGE